MSESGKLIVFEGCDGVGKTTVSRGLVDQLGLIGIPCIHVGFPGNTKGTLGRLVYNLHHEPASFGIERLSPASIQLMHVAAHLDNIQNEILPALHDGKWVVLDRYWWSTWVCGLVSGVDKATLEAMLKVESICWDDVVPLLAFLLHRYSAPFTDNQSSQGMENRYSRLEEKYKTLVKEQSDRYPIHIIDNNGSVEEAVTTVLEHTLSYIRASQQNG